MPKILIACIHYPVSSGRYMANAFAHIGCDVRTAGPTQGNYIWGVEVDPKYTWQPTYTAGNMAGDYGIKGILGKFDDWSPDLIVCMDSSFTILGDKADFPCPKVLYGVDNHLKAYNRWDEWYDHLFLAHHDGPELPVSGPDKTWLPCAYDKRVFTPSPIPMAERKYDVALLGWPTPERVELVDAMEDAGINVKAGLGAIYEQYRDIYWNSKISLCRSAEQDVAQRVFETAAMGCVILTNDVPDLARLEFYGGRHGLIYHSIAEAIDSVQFLLSHVKAATTMARYGWQWAAPHSWDARAKTILERMGLT